MIKLQPATKVLKPLKGFLYGPTASGKTYSSLLIANGIVQEIRKCAEEEAYKHIVLIDTEYGRGSLYAGTGEYNYIECPAPYDTEKLVAIIKELNDMPDIDVIIIDSLTHFWAKKGGILEQKTLADAKGGNSYTNWNIYTSKFNEMIDTILESPKHVLITARAKSDTVMVENAKGKLEPKTYGLKPELRDGFEFECDFTFNVDKVTHSLIVEKNIPGMETMYDPATPDLGKLIHRLSTENAKEKVRTNEDIANSIRDISRSNGLIQFVQLALSGRKLEALSLEDISKLEKDLIAEVKKKQVKR